MTFINYDDFLFCFYLLPHNPSPRPAGGVGVEAAFPLGSRNSIPRSPPGEAAHPPGHGLTSMSLTWLRGGEYRTAMGQRDMSRETQR